MMTSRWRRFSILTAFFIKIVITSFSFELSPSSYEPQGRNGVGLLILNATPVGHRHAVGFFESGSHFTGEYWRVTVDVIDGWYSLI